MATLTFLCTVWSASFDSIRISIIMGILNSITTSRLLHIFPWKEFLLGWKLYQIFTNHQDIETFQSNIILITFYSFIKYHYHIGSLFFEKSIQKNISLIWLWEGMGPTGRHTFLGKYYLVLISKKTKCQYDY